MTININVDPSNNLTIFTGTGAISFDEAIKCIRSFYDSNPTSNVLFDLRKASAEQISSSQIKQIAEFLQELRRVRKGGRTAIVSATDVDFGLARMLQIFTSMSDSDASFEMKVFRDIKAASLWVTGSD